MDDELKIAVRELFEKYLNHAEESDSGRLYKPVQISCSRALMTEPLNILIEKIRKLSGAAHAPRTF